MISTNSKTSNNFRFDLEIPKNYNPADFYIQQLAIYPKSREENLRQIETICNAYEKSSQNARYMSEVVKLHSTYSEEENESFFVKLCNGCFSKKDEPIDPNSNDIQKKGTSRYKTNSFTQFRWLVWRNFVDVFKNPFEIRLRIILALVCHQLLSFLSSIQSFVCLFSSSVH